MLLLPVRALYAVDVVVVRIPAQVLPVVGVYTAGTVVADVAERTELSLVVEDEEVLVIIEVVQ